MCIRDSFYEDHVDNPPLEYRDCMEAIYVLNQEICGAKEHLKLLQGIRLCPDCQGESPIDAAFCAYCGHPFPPLEEDTPSLPDERLCPRCGEKLADNAIFCIKCGLRLDVYKRQHLRCRNRFLHQKALI